MENMIIEVHARSAELAARGFTEAEVKQLRSYLVRATDNALNELEKRKEHEHEKVD